MADTWVVDLRHFIDEDGDLPDKMPTPALNRALFFDSIVALVTDHLPARDPHTNVPCWRSPGRKRCLGEIMAELRLGSDEITWQCPLCGDHGVIRGWEQTLWNRQPGLSDTGGRS
jgi:hypothetical protein